MNKYLVLLIVSILANALAALSGGGAGLLQFPALLFLGLPFSVALSTHKIATVALGVGSAARYFSEGIINKRLALFILVTGVPGAIVGANLILKVNDAHAKTALGFLMLIPGIYSFFNRGLGTIQLERNRSVLGYTVGGFILFLIGVMNGSLTSGTGLLVTLWLVRWFGLDYKTAVAFTMILVGLFWNGAGAITLFMLGSVKWDWLVPLLLGSFVGGYVGANVALKKGNDVVKRSFELVTITVGIMLIYKGWK